MFDGVKRSARDLAAISSKPLMIAELGSNDEGGDKAAWIRDGYRAVYAELPRIEAIVYLDVDTGVLGHPDWGLSSPASALSAYAEIAALPRFGAEDPFGWGGQDLKARLAAAKRAEDRARLAARKRERARIDRASAGQEQPRVKTGPGEPEAKPARKASSSGDRVSGPKRTSPAKEAPAEPTETLDTFSR